MRKANYSYLAILAIVSILILFQGWVKLGSVIILTALALLFIDKAIRGRVARAQALSTQVARAQELLAQARARNKTL